MQIILLLALAIVLAPIFLTTNKRMDQSESSLVNGHWLEDREKFHLLSRWGAQH